tara:strand:+ start:738 stop:1673 length:936 start_codon:yes stop_codon:yes gene_type:complete
MIIIDSKTIKHYKDNGWCILKSGFSNAELLNYQKKVFEIEKRAKKINFKLGRVYYDYIYSFNLGAVEAPLNQIVCNNEVLEFFHKVKIGDAVKKIMNWDNTICSLMRLFCMSNYNYSGHWHKDTIIDNIDAGEDTAMQASIIFNDECGFKIIKKEYKHEFSNYFEKLRLQTPKNLLPTLLNKKYYHTLDVKLGDIILFEPFLLHKGSSNNKRLQFHMRFQNFDKENNLNVFKPENFDFSFTDEYNFTKSEDEIIGIHGFQRSSIYRRLKNSINYYFPLSNFKSYLKQKKDLRFKYEFFSNTAFQGKNSVKK